ncbi:MAG: hypothetical protein H6Q57_1819 [Geobacteraceae bacterium]|jgi:hypothetical protein|nr:hypothetical protein [Geobacteraceae bacterium]
MLRTLWPLKPVLALSVAVPIQFIRLCLGRFVSGATEHQDHEDFGREIDIRVHTTEYKELTKPKELE